MLSDDEAFAHLPAVREFRDAVVERDTDLVEACFAFTDPRTLAVWCAELWDEAQHDCEALRVELTGERDSAAQVRAELQRMSAVGGSVNARLVAEVRRLRGKVQELREILDARADASHGRRKVSA